MDEMAELEARLLGIDMTYLLPTEADLNEVRKRELKPLLDGEVGDLEEEKHPVQPVSKHDKALTCAKTAIKQKFD